MCLMHFLCLTGLQCRLSDTNGSFYPLFHCTPYVALTGGNAEHISFSLQGRVISVLFLSQKGNNLTLFPFTFCNSFICFKVSTNKRCFFLLLTGKYTLKTTPKQQRNFSEIHLGTEIGTEHLLIASVLPASVFSHRKFTDQSLWFLILCLPVFYTGFLESALEIFPHETPSLWSLPDITEEVFDSPNSRICQLSPVQSHC